MVRGLGVGGNGGFIGSKEGTQFGNGHVTEMPGGWWTKGKGGMKVAWKGVDEGRVTFVWCDIRLVVSKKNLIKGGG